MLTDVVVVDRAVVVPTVERAPALIISTEMPGGGYIGVIRSIKRSVKMVSSFVAPSFRRMQLLVPEEQTFVSGAL